MLKMNFDYLTAEEFDLMSEEQLNHYYQKKEEYEKECNQTGTTIHQSVIKETQRARVG